MPAGLKEEGTKNSLNRMQKRPNNAPLASFGLLVCPSLLTALRLRALRRGGAALGRGRGGESALDHQRLNARVAATEGALSLGRVNGVPDREDVLAQARGDLLVIRPAGFGERAERIGRYHVGP